MHRLLALVTLLTFGSVFSIAQVPSTKPANPLRFNIEADPDAFPQGSAKQAFGSVIKAIEEKRFDYLLAQLSDPQFVDGKLKEFGGDFPKFVDITRRRLAEDPETLKDLRKFLLEGEIQEAGDSASIKSKGLPNRQVFLKKVGDRWFFENRQKPQ